MFVSLVFYYSCDYFFFVHRIDAFFVVSRISTIHLFSCFLTSYVKIMHTCKSVLKYYNFIFYTVFAFVSCVSTRNRCCRFVINFCIVSFSFFVSAFFACVIRRFEKSLCDRVGCRRSGQKGVGKGRE